MERWQEFLSVETADLAAAYYAAHRQACETWTHGNINEVWYDDSGNLCIRYADGQWFHYHDNETGNGVEWW